MNKRELQFNVSARTAKLIGLENFANAEGAIIELVKNAYDADSDCCVVIFDIKDALRDSAIYIIDTGDGMNDDIIVKHWMTIGTDDKLKNSKTTKKGRIKSGAKGIGRFALNKLGKQSAMITFPESANNGYYWTIDWSDFDKDGYNLSDIKAELAEVNDTFFDEKIQEYGIGKLEIVQKLTQSKFHGTLIRISDLNDVWSEGTILSLNQNLETLVPAHLSSDFSMYLYDLADTERYGEINSVGYEDYDYKVEASYPGDGSRKVKIGITRNELNLSLLESSYQGLFALPDMKAFPYRLEDFLAKTFETEIELGSNIKQELLSNIGQFGFVFYFIKNDVKDDPDEFSEKKYPYNNIDSRQRKRWLKKFGGVKIFRDDFRVRPYGENGDDWLGLGKRQSQSPGGAGQKKGGYRIRPNQISGAVSISRIHNAVFDDRSSREGIQENDEFRLLKNILLRVIEEFEADRNTVMYNLSALYKASHQEETKASDIADKVLSEEEKHKGRKGGKKGRSSKTSRDLASLAKGYQVLRDNLSEKEEENRMLRSLASTGVAVASFTHELNGVSESLLPRTDLLKSALRGFVTEEEIHVEDKLDNPYYLIDLIRNQDAKLHQWLDYSLNAIKRNKRDRTDMSMKDYFGRYLDLWKASLLQKNIQFEVLPNPKETTMDSVLNCYEMDLDSIFNNFVTNAVSSLIRTPRDDKKIQIHWKTDNQFLVVDFVDNGLGLAEEYKNDPNRIFNAFETSSCDSKGNKIGTGMGLFIVKSVVDSYPDATVSLTEGVENGFGIRVMFNIGKNQKE